METKVKETGIIMSGDHPIKCMDGTKTNTRRTYGLGEINKKPDEWVCHGIDNPFGLFVFENTEGFEPRVKCPYGQVGDHLWVRETWAAMSIFDNRSPSQLDVGTPIGFYDTDWDLLTGCGYDEGKKRPSIHMPRWASRITLEITEVRVERLRDISEADAKAEGGYSIEEFIMLFLRLNHLSDDANPWEWPISFKEI